MQASLVAQMVKKKKSLPAVQETWVGTLGQEDPPEKGLATHSSSLTCRIPWTEEPGVYSSGVTGSQTRLGDSHSPFSAPCRCSRKTDWVGRITDREGGEGLQAAE